MLSQTSSRSDIQKRFNLPTGLVTAFGLSLGLLGVVYLLVNPEPLMIWTLELLLITVPAATLAYGGYWTVSHSQDRADHWIVLLWTLGGGIITSGFIFGYLISEWSTRSFVPEMEQLVLFSALGGSFVAFLVVTTIQYQYRQKELSQTGEDVETTVLTLHNARFVLDLLRRGRTGGVTGLVTEVCFGRNVWLAYIKRFKTTDGLVPFETQGVTLFLDPDDQGISKDLLMYGTREETATEVIRRETMSLRSATKGPIRVLDIGANRGYYTFQFSDILDEDDTVFAIEPEPHNVVALRRGVETNQVQNVGIEQGAIGAEDGTQELMVSTRSNSHTLNSDLPKSKEDTYRSSIEVPVWSIETFLKTRDLGPEEIDIVKIDVEGYEPEVIESMEPIFQAGGPNLLFVELHPHRVDTSTLHEIVDTIEINGFEIITASSSAADDLPTYQSVREHVDSDDGSHTVELIVRSK